MGEKSHIQITKKLLFYFSHRDFDNKGEGSFVYFLNLTNFEIECKRISDFGTSIRYYNEKIEDLLNNHYENSFGSLIKKIIIGKASVNEITPSEMGSAAKFAFSSRFRRKQLHADLREYFDKHGKTIGTTNIIKSIELIENDIKPDYLLLLRNATSRNFVVPFNCLMNVRNFHDLKYVLPISPSIALGFVGVECLKSGCFEINVTQKEVEIVNYCAFRTELQNNGFVISKDKESLRNLMQYREESKNGYFKFKA